MRIQVASWFCANAIRVDGDGRVYRSSMQPSGYTHAPTQEELRKNGIWPSITSSWVIRRSAVEKCGRFVESFGRHWGGEDSLLFFQARHLGSFHYMPDASCDSGYRLRWSICESASTASTGRFPRKNACSNVLLEKTITGCDINLCWI